MDSLTSIQMGLDLGPSIVVETNKFYGHASPYDSGNTLLPATSSYKQAPSLLLSISNIRVNAPESFFCLLRDPFTQIQVGVRLCIDAPNFGGYRRSLIRHARAPFVSSQVIDWIHVLPVRNYVLINEFNGLRLDAGELCTNQP